MGADESRASPGELASEVAELRKENARLRGLLGLDARSGDGHKAAWAPTLLVEPSKHVSVDNESPDAEKLVLLWSLFGARSDVHATRWGSASTGKARAMGAALLRQAMTARAEFDLSSYDRFFPSQDFLPRAGFGNLIALPLQGGCVQRSFAELAKAGGPPPPKVIRARLGAMLSIERAGLPPGLVAALKHLGSISNPEFYEKQRMRFSTWDTPRFISAYGKTSSGSTCPGGLSERVEELISGLGSRLEVTEAWTAPALCISSTGPM